MVLPPLFLALMCTLLKNKKRCSEYILSMCSVHFYHLYTLTLEFTEIRICNHTNLNVRVGHTRNQPKLKKKTKDPTKTYN